MPSPNFPSQFLCMSDEGQPLSVICHTPTYPKDTGNRVMSRMIVAGEDLRALLDPVCRSVVPALTLEALARIEVDKALVGARPNTSTNEGAPPASVR